MAVAAAAGFLAARVVSKAMASPTVCLLGLRLLEDQGSDFFRPGQWVDFVVPGCEWVGGFSFASSPAELPLCRLAVKKSNDQPATFVHEKLQLQDIVHVRVGGDFVLKDSPAATPKTVVFVAGGIGISPILSMYRAFLERPDRRAKSALLYSVSTFKELVFGDEITNLLTRHGRAGEDTCMFALTQSTKWTLEQENSVATPSLVTMRTGRQLGGFLNDEMHHPLAAAYYLCGPPKMVDDAIQILREAGVAESQLNYEKWW